MRIDGARPATRYALLLGAGVWGLLSACSEPPPGDDLVVIALPAVGMPPVLLPAPESVRLEPGVPTPVGGGMVSAGAVYPSHLDADGIHSSPSANFWVSSSTGPPRTLVARARVGQCLAVAEETYRVASVASYEIVLTLEPPGSCNGQEMVTLGQVAAGPDHVIGSLGP